MESKEHLRQLILLEEFKNCLPEVVSVYLNDQKAVTLEQAAILADEFVLTHKVNFGDKQAEFLGQSKPNRSRFVKSVPLASSPAKKITNDGSISERVCFYCKRPGHLITDCHVLSKKQKSTKTVAFVSPVPSFPLASSVANLPCKKGELASSSSFLMDGFVCLSADPEQRQAIEI